MSSRGRPLTREEQEVRDACFSASDNENGSNPVTPNPYQRPPNSVNEENNPAPKSDPLDQLSQILAQSLINSGLITNPACQKRANVNTDRNNNSLFSKKPKSDLPMPTGKPLVAIDTSNIDFGIDVNPPHNRDEDGNGLGYDEPSIVIPADALISNPKSTKSSVVADQNLPQNNSDIPNWFPDEGVLLWAESIVDSEWSIDDRKAVMKQFIPEKEHKHLFDAVQMPPKALEAIKHQLTSEKDYLFKRSTTETYLYNVNLDITTCYRPLLEVISNLTDVPDQHENRYLLGKVFQGLSSSAIRLSRGRRELARKFVPLSNAPAIFRTTPSHKSVFGGSLLKHQLTRLSRPPRQISL